MKDLRKKGCSVLDTASSFYVQGILIHKKDAPRGQLCTMGDFVLECPNRVCDAFCDFVTIILIKRNPSFDGCCSDIRRRRQQQDEKTNQNTLF